MQRVTQMSVTPDLLAEIRPEVDVQIKIAGQEIEPGVFTLPSQVSRCSLACHLSAVEANRCFSHALQTIDGFEVAAQVFHPEERLYTLLVVDPDVPDEASSSFSTLAHWLV